MGRTGLFIAIVLTALLVWGGVLVARKGLELNDYYNDHLSTMVRKSRG